MARAPTASKVFHFVHALRGFAALLVCGFHFVLGWQMRGDPPAIPAGGWAWRYVWHDFDWGRWGVSLFFLVSGFLIPETLRKPGTTLRSFVIHRAFRLYPAYWFSIAVAVLFCSLVPGRMIRPPLLTLAVNVTMLQGFVRIPDVIGAFWTLQIELVFYVLCAFCFVKGWLEKRATALALASAAMLAAGALRHFSGRAMPVAIPLALTMMVYGDMIRAHEKGELSTRTLVVAGGAVVGALVPSCLLAYADFGPGAILSNWAALATFFLAYGARGWFARPGLVRSVGTFYGDISYSFYVLHSHAGLEPGGFVLRRTGSPALGLLVCFGGATLASWLAYKWIEVPGIQMGRRLSGKWATLTSARSAVTESGGVSTPP